MPRLRDLLKHAGDSLSAALELTPSALAALSFTERQQQRYKEAVEARYGAKLQEAAQALQMHVLRHSDAAYPAALREVDDAPLFLFVRGALSEQDADAIAIVGSRRMTPYGREQAAQFARVFAEQGMTVVSGGALGIDTAAHTAVWKRKTPALWRCSAVGWTRPTRRITRKCSNRSRTGAVRSSANIRSARRPTRGVSPPAIVLSPPCHALRL